MKEILTIYAIDRVRNSIYFISLIGKFPVLLLTVIYPYFGFKKKQK